MAERIYNIYIFYENDVCSTVGYTVHDHYGSDDEGTDFLKARVYADLKVAVRLSLKKPFTRDEYNAWARLGESHYLIDEVFSTIGASMAPLFVSTPVKDGEIFFNHSNEHHEISDIRKIGISLDAQSVMSDWLIKYKNEGGINLSQLIHDDYFLAIKLTFNAKLYVSAMKLLASCIDSLAYIEYGDQQGSFVEWLNTYADLAPLGITATELWEFRNGILHMTNVHSKKVRQNKVRRISLRVGGPSGYPREDINGCYYFDFYGLIKTFAAAQAKWIDSYNHNRDKFAKFIERYDETISDSRQAVTHL